MNLSEDHRDLLLIHEPERSLRETTRVLGIIPARGGSKEVPRKNIRMLADKPLIAWTFEAVRTCAVLDRVIVSTDDPEIADLAVAWGGDVPFLRPADLARDDTPDFPVYQHALAWLAEQEGYIPDVVVWLRPTAPLRTGGDIEAAVRLLVESGADCVRSVCETEHHPFWMKRMHEGRLLPFQEGKDEQRYYRRQLLPPVYRLNGVIDVVRRRPLREDDGLFSGDVRGYVMSPERSIDLDTEMDFLLAELLLAKRSR